MLSRTVRNCLAIVAGFAFCMPNALEAAEIMFSQRSVPAAKAARQPAVGFIHDIGEFFNNSGCSLWLLHDRSYTASRYVLLSDFKKGARSRYHYRSKSVDVVVRYTLIRPCSYEGCEAEGYNATLTVQTHSGKRVVRAQGVCGS